MKHWDMNELIACLNLAQRANQKLNPVRPMDARAKEYTKDMIDHVLKYVDMWKENLAAQPENKIQPKGEKSSWQPKH